MSNLTVVEQPGQRIFDADRYPYQGTALRVVMLNGEPHFVAKDVCDVLGLGNVTRSIDRLEADEKGLTVVNTPGGPQEMSVINESGLYALIFTSRKPEARDFKHWVTHEVLPSIRKTGSYAVKQDLDERRARVELFKTAIDHEERLSGIEQRIEQVERSTTLDHGEQRRVQKAIAHRVYSLVTDLHDRPEYFRQLYREIRDRWGVASYRDVRRVELDEVLRYIDAWRPRIA